MWSLAISVACVFGRNTYDNNANNTGGSSHGGTAIEASCDLDLASKGDHKYTLVGLSWEYIQSECHNKMMRNTRDYVVS